MTPDPVGGTTRREVLARGAGTAAALTLGGGLTAAVARAGAPPRASFALGLTPGLEPRDPRAAPSASRAPAALARRRAAAERPGAVRGRASARFTTGSTAWRCCTASPSPAAGHLRQPLPALGAWRGRQATGEMQYSEFATDPCRSLFRRVASMFEPAPGANGAVTSRVGDEFLATTESPPRRFDPETRSHPRRGDEPPGTLRPRIPTTTRRAGSALTSTPTSSPGSRTRFDAAAPAARAGVIAKRGRDPGYMHSFGAQRALRRPLRAAVRRGPAVFSSPARKPIIENYRWEGTQPSRFHRRRPRAAGLRATVEMDPFFVFHHVNANERGAPHLDLCAHEDSPIIDALYLERLRKAEQRIPRVRVRRIEWARPAHVATARPLRRRLRAAANQLRPRQPARPPLCLRGLGRRTPASRSRASSSSSTPTRATLDVARPAATPASRCSCRPGARREDDGVVLSVVLDAGRGTSFLLVLDAPTLEERARAAVPHHIPFGFHGMHVAA